MRFQGLLGIAVFLAVAWSVSENRKGVKYSAVLAGVGVQLSIAVVLL